jgi:hypothetical protein
MIRYDLLCGKGHAFDGWFRDSAAFDAQAAAGDVACPVCADTAVEKQLMTPRLPAKSNRKSEAGPPAPAATPAVAMHAGLRDERTRKLAEMVRELRRHVEQNADYVGDRFAEEARRIHYEESAARGIYGEATLEDARELLEEGIAVAPLPRPPDDAN